MKEMNIREMLETLFDVKTFFFSESVTEINFQAMYECTLGIVNI